MVEGEAPPEGWMGKCHALHIGQQHATGRTLLFIDADVRLEPESVRQALSYLRKEEAGVLSVFGRLVMESFWEWTVQPVIGGLILQNNDPAKVNDPDDETVMANGQFILATREAYDEFGGHEAIKGEILDDVAFARAAIQAGVTYRLAYGRELFRCRMYSSFSDIWEGWSKNLFPGLNYDLPKTIVIIILLFLTNGLPQRRPHEQKPEGHTCDKEVHVGLP